MLMLSMRIHAWLKPSEGLATTTLVDAQNGQRELHCVTYDSLTNRKLRLSVVAERVVIVVVDDTTLTTCCGIAIKFGNPLRSRLGG